MIVSFQQGVRSLEQDSVKEGEEIVKRVGVKVLEHEGVHVVRARRELWF